MPENSSKSQGYQEASKINKKISTKISNCEENPCIKEADISLKCLQNNFYQRDECIKEYINYNECKKFWGRVRYQRRARGIKPILPPSEEREKILEMKAKGINTFSAQ